jgi:hypothetical protein
MNFNNVFVLFILSSSMRKLYFCKEFEKLKICKQINYNNNKCQGT